MPRSATPTVGGGRGPRRRVTGWRRVGRARTRRPRPGVRRTRPGRSGSRRGRGGRARTSVRRSRRGTVDAVADGVNDGLRSLLAADVPFSAEATESAEVAESAESAAGAASVCWLVSQPLSPELIVCRLPCRSLPRPLAPADPDESADRPFALPIVSAGSGTSVLDPASVVPASRCPRTRHPRSRRASPEVAASTESSEAAVSPKRRSPRWRRRTAATLRSVSFRFSSVMMT